MAKWGISQRGQTKWTQSRAGTKQSVGWLAKIAK
jgi:hypothetical protein